MLRGMALMSLVPVLMLGIAFPIDAARRGDSAEGTSKRPESTISCEGVVEYTDVLFTTIEEHGDYSDFWINGDYDTIQQQDQGEIQNLVDDGRALLADLEVLEVPGVYQSGHRGIMLLFDNDVDTIEFLGVDAYTVPDFDQWDRGLALILEGEKLVANECPDETEEVGGFIFFSIETLEDALGQ